MTLGPRTILRLAGGLPTPADVHAITFRSLGPDLARKKVDQVLAAVEEAQRDFDVTAEQVWRGFIRAAGKRSEVELCIVLAALHEAETAGDVNNPSTEG